MTATVTIKEVNGVTPTYTTKSVGAPARFCTKDLASPAATYPCVIAASGLHYSYWKHFCLDLATGTGFSTINNVRFYTDGDIGWTLGTDGRVVAGQRDDPTTDKGHGVPLATDYQQAGGDEGVSGYPIKDGTDGHAYYKGETADLKNVEDFYDATHTCDVDTADHTTAEKTKAIVLQVEIDDDATQGEQVDETFTFLYDEV